MTPDPLPPFQALAQAFYEVDPLNTCCVPNGSTDEYASEARATLENMKAGLSLHDAICESLVFFFEIEKNRAYRHAVEVEGKLYTNRMLG